MQEKDDNDGRSIAASSLCIVFKKQFEYKSGLPGGLALPTGRWVTTMPA